MRARIVVVGLGRIGRLHAANLAARAELAGVVDACEPLAREIGELYGVPHWATLPAVPGDVGGVVIAAPTALHADLVVAAAEAGLDVLCEKPLGFEPAAALRAIEAAQAAGVALRVGFQRRFDPDWIALSDALANGELGELRLLRISHRNAREPEQAAALGDLFVDVAVHDLDSARWLGGEVSDLYAVERHGAATVSLCFESGALGLIDVTRRASYGFECAVELVGSRATARAGTSWRRRQIELLSGGDVVAPIAADHAERHAAAYRAELDAFAAVVRGEPARGATGEDALAAHELVRLARRSARPRAAAA